jgi:hypothetical protein
MCTAPQNIKFREGTTTKNNILCALHPKIFKFRENRTKKKGFICTAQETSQALHNKPSKPVKSEHQGEV